MAEITKRNLLLSFGTTGGKTVNLTVNTPNPALEDAEVVSAMDAIIAAGALGSEEVVSTKVEAKYVVQEEESIALN